jgi:hypothetical protein
MWRVEKNYSKAELERPTRENTESHLLPIASNIG